MKKRSLILSISVLIVLTLTRCGAPMLSLNKKKLIFENKTVYVYPVHVLRASSNFDSTTSKQIVTFINQQGGFKAVYNSKIPGVNSTWGVNEAKMFKNSFRAFTNCIKPDTAIVEYGLLVEFLYQPFGIVGVHYYLVDNKESKGVILRILNSHNKTFQEINPKNNMDAFNLFCKEFTNDKNELVNEIAKQK
jgi:hypothetical protein